jgi:hypothetical protein
VNIEKQIYDCNFAGNISQSCRNKTFLDATEIYIKYSEINYSIFSEIN